MGKNAPALGNFNAGELSPDFAGRVDNEKYPVGCDTLSNFIPRVQGPARRRPGSRYVQSVKNSANRTWLRRFVFSQGQAYQIEFGDKYCRFYTNHGQVQTAGVAAWSNSPTYAVGSLVSQGGVNYYCVAVNQNQVPPNATYWYAMPGTVYEIPSPYGVSDLINSDGSCALQLEQSGDVVYIGSPTVWPQTLTRLGATDWVFALYAPPDGPFQEQNAANSPAVYATLPSPGNGTVTITASAALFDPSDVGRLFRVDTQYFNTPTWQNNVAYAAGNLVRYNGNTYMALNAATSGPNPPVQTSGTQFDGKSAVLWLYQDSGYGIGTITGYSSSTSVTVTVSPYAGQKGSTAGLQYYRFPAATLGATFAISGITQANPAVVTAVGHTFVVGDAVYITGVGGMTQISEQMYIVTAIGANTITLGQVDSTGFSAYTAGGTAVKNATLRWQIGEWGGLSNPRYPGTYPRAVCFYADRLFWGRGIKWWGSAPGQYDSHTQDLFSLVTADCAVSGNISSQDVDEITWMSPLNILLMGTRGGEFGLGPIVNTQPIGPGNTQVVRQSKFRSRAIRAEIVGTSNFYVQASGKKVMAQDYNFYLDKYDSTNQNRLANHIAGYSVNSGIIDLAYHAEPYEALWSVRSDGVLIGYVFDRPDNVTGWNEHPMGASKGGAAVVECASVNPAPDGTRDELWLIVKRTINGSVVRSIEYLEKDYETGDAQNSMCYVDMSGTYNGAPTTIVTGLSWLEGETVSVLRDGGGHPDCVVSGGQITLQTAGSVVQVGLACPADLITMDIEGGADVGTAQGKVKRAVSATIRLKNTLGGYAGMAGSPLDLMQPNVSTTSLGSPPPLLTGDVERMSFPGDYDTRCKIHIQQAQPFAMEVLAIFPIITVQEPSPP